MEKLSGKEQAIIESYLLGVSAYQLAEQFGVSRTPIYNVLKRNGIKMRTSRENNILRFNNDKPLSYKLLNCINGWLLGDGGLHYTGNQAYFCFAQKHEEYVDYIIDLFEKEHVHCRKYHSIDKKFKTDSYRLFTESTTQFAELYNLWYLDKKKIVPKNLELSPESITFWIMDDGTLNKSGAMRLSTNAFSFKDAEYLCKKLDEFVGIYHVCWIQRDRDYPRIYIPRKYYKKLITKIIGCPCNCLMYKWHIIDCPDEPHTIKILDICVEKILKMYNDGQSYSAIGREYGFDHHSIKKFIAQCGGLSC
ncbi:MAG: hypothetical protein WC523_00720 [Patescibacteria group bacterium]